MTGRGPDGRHALIAGRRRCAKLVGGGMGAAGLFEVA